MAISVNLQPHLLLIRFTCSELEPLALQSDIFVFLFRSFLASELSRVQIRSCLQVTTTGNFSCVIVVFE
jgi:hypothetical protein